MSDPVSDTYQSWMERMMGGRDAKPLSNDGNEIVKSSAGEPFGVIEFARTERKHYVGEVGRKGADYIYHFFPPPSTHSEGVGFKSGFEDKLGDAFLELFKIPERVLATYSDELKSWAVRVVGYADNPNADELAIKVFDVLDKTLE